MYADWFNLVYISHCNFICMTGNKEKDNSKQSLYSLLCILLKNQLGLCLSWKSVHGSIQSSSSHFIFFLWKWPHFWLIKHQFACLPAMIVLLSPLHPSSALYSNTLRSLHSQQQAAAALTMPCCVCLHSVISLLTVGMLSVFVSPFSFFHAQHYAEEVLCIPCQFQYVPPAHSCLAFTLYLASLLFLLIFSPHSLATLDWFWVL